MEHLMELLHKNGIYVLSCDYNQRHWPKGAGFRWHRSPCLVRSCKVCEIGHTEKCWWIDKPSVAIRLKEHATEECRKGLKQYEVEVSEAVKESRAEDADIEVPVPEGQEYRGFQKAAIAYALKREATIIADECGLGKCFSPFSTIWVNDALVTCVDVFEAFADLQSELEDDGGYWYGLRSPLMVPSIDKKGKIVSGQVRRLYRQKVKERLRRIQLDDGSEITCTWQHSLLTLNGWTNELALGDTVCVPQSVPSCGKSEDVDLELVEFLAWQISEGIEYSPRDGRGYSVVISQKERSILDKLRETILRLGVRYGFSPYSCPIRSDDRPNRRVWTLSINSKSYMLWLGENFGYEWGHRSKGKRIPDAIVAGSLETLRCFLRHYFDAEAAVLKDGIIEISSASKFLIQQLTLMLRRLGIWMRHKTKMKCATNGKKIKRPYQVGIIGGSSLREFALQIGFNTDYKQERLGRICKKVCNDNVTGIPSRCLLGRLRQASQLPLRLLGAGTSYFRGSHDASKQVVSSVCLAARKILDGRLEAEYRVRPRTRWTDQTLSLFKKAKEPRPKREIETILRELEILRATEVYYAKVLSIEELDYEGWVYDFEIEDHHNYVAGGLLSHNTIQALGVVNAAERPQKVLVICPAGLRLNWEREAAKWLVDNWRIRVVEKDLPTDDDWDVLILNYDKFAGQRRQEFTDYCASHEWDVVILDEAHYLKNPKAQRTEAILATRSRKRGPKGVIGRAKKKLFLTGTPILNRPVDLWPMLKTAAPNEFNDYQYFTARFCNRHFNGYAWDVSGKSNLDELQEKLRSTCMIRRLKKDVLKELPPKIRQIIPIPAAGRLNKLLKEEKQAYEKIQSKIKDVEKKVQAAFDAASKKSGKRGDSAKLAAYADNQYRQAVANLRRRMASFEELAGIRHDIAVAKLPFVIEQLENALAETDKVVVFAHHRDVCEAIRDHFGRKAVLLYGGMNNREGDRAVRRFQEDEKIKVFVGSIQAAGVGLTLTASSTVIFAELDWVPANMMQATDRCHRIGQTDVVNVIYLVVDGSLDAHLAVTLINKQEIIETALDRQTEAEKQADLSRRDVMEPDGEEDIEKPKDEADDIWGWGSDSEEDAQDELVVPVSKIFRAARMKGWPTTLRPARLRRLLQSSEQDRLLAKEAVEVLYGDKNGFNLYDQHLGRLLAEVKEFNDRQVDIARGLAQKYRRLLPSRLLEGLGIHVVGQRNLF